MSSVKLVRPAVNNFIRTLLIGFRALLIVVVIDFYLPLKMRILVGLSALRVLKSLAYSLEENKTQAILQKIYQIKPYSAYKSGGKT